MRLNLDEMPFDFDDDGILDPFERGLFEDHEEREMDVILGTHFHPDNRIPDNDTDPFNLFGDDFCF